MITVYLSLLCKVFFDIMIMTAFIYGVIQLLLGLDIGKLFKYM